MLAAIDPAGLAFFEQKIRPVLAEQCYECHSASAKKLKAGLLLDSRAGWQRGGDSGEPAIVPGQPEQSLLLRALRHDDPELAMPPKKPRLPDAVLADFVTWVRMGAPDPREEERTAPKRADKTWWSLQPLAATATTSGPAGETASATLDRLIDAALAAKDLRRNPPADPRTLIRRMTYDLLGLPPTPAEVETFVAAHAAQPQAATENLVDRLLASPHYGEQWGRHWLDVIRFGESNGFERNFVIDDLWPFRDYVIQSLNADKPFNRFITEHLAGDVVGRDQPDVEVATAFLVAGPYDDVKNQDAAATAGIRAATLDDLITATSGAFLGLTINCARCHAHKFDPIPTEDYYRLRAAFEGVEHGRRTMATPAERAAYTAATQPLNQELARLNREKKVVDDAITARARAELARQVPARPRIDPQRTEERFPPVAARMVRFVIHADTANPRRSPGGPGPRGTGRLTEFEVWSAGEAPRNVALARAGGRAEGARSAVAEDFPEAYGPQFTIDGKFGEQWFIGTPAELTITLAQTETIDRIAFSNAKDQNIEDKAQGATPCEYEVQVSLDGRAWSTVASSDDRAPWSPAHGIERLRRSVTTPEETTQLAELNRQIARTQQQLNAVPKLRQVWAGNFAAPAGPTFVHKGGDPQKPGEPVRPASLGVLDALLPRYELPADAPESARRAALAAWITHDDNALALRVLANRVWQHHFGTGIVDTPSDFGFLGGPPSHPELLEFLAGRLRAHGWRLKPLHREILLSATYRQSSAFHPDHARVDHDARGLWRFPPRRLAAEEVRDTLLHVTGRLDLRPGGPGFRLYKFTQNNVCTYFPLDRPGPETYRRAVYHQNARASVVDILSDFDLPDIAFAAPRRANTTTPLQALTLLNHGFILDLASALAAEIAGPDPIAAAYARLLQRPPSPAERTAGTELIRGHGLNAFCRALLNMNELIYLD